MVKILGTTLHSIHPGILFEEGAAAETLSAWIGKSADLTLVLDDAGIIHEVICRRIGLWRELEGAADWRGRSWSSTASRQTQPAVDALMRDAFAEHAPDQRHVDLLTLAGRTIPALFATARVNGHIIAFGQDLRTLDLTTIVLEHDASVARAYAAAMRDAGMSLETLWLDVLAPAARRLGDLWIEDACSFTEVTVGVGHLQDVLRVSAPLVEPTAAETRSILLAAPAAEQHTFGLAMVSALFRQDGWLVQQENAASDSALTQAVSRHWFAVAGLTASEESRLGPLAATIRKLRRASRNGAIGIMVGGKVFADRPELAAEIGADLAAFDGRQAVRRAQRFLDGHRDEAAP